MLQVCLLAVAGLLGSASSVVLGIDMGSEFYKISLIKPGKLFEMVENLNSKTNTYSALSFFDNRRLKEYEAFTRVIRVPHNSFYMFNKYIGRSLSDPVLKRQQALHLDDYSIKTLEDGTEVFEIRDFKLPVLSEKDVQIARLEGKIQLRLEEIVGMVMEHARWLSSQFAKTDVKDAYFSVPPWFGPAERKTLFSIAKLAGLNPQGFASENTGAATYYAINRQATAKNETVVFYNVGAQATKTSIFKFENIVDNKNNTQETYTLLAEAWDEEAGGYSIDNCLARHFAAEFSKKFKLPSIAENVKIMRRLNREANKAKEVLSANKEVSMIVEEVSDGKDFSLRLTREDFDTICREPVDRSVKTIGVAIERAGIKKEDIDSIQIIGGASRIPLGHALIKEYYGKEHSYNMNGDNSMAMGLSYIAANFSTQFKTKKFYLTHGPAYDVRVIVRELASGNELNNTVVFKRFTSFGARQVLFSSSKKDLEVELIAEPIEPVAGRDNYAIRYNITGIEKFYDNLTESEGIINDTVRIGVMVDPLGLPIVGLSDIFYVKEVEEKIPPKNKSDTTEEPQTKKVQKPMTHSVSYNMSYDSHRCLLETPDKFRESMEILRRFKNTEEFVNKNKEERNKLESFIFQARELKSNDVLLPYAREEERNTLEKLAEEMDEWLFSEEAKLANFTLFGEKSTDFGKILDSIKGRKLEHAQRDQTVSGAHDKFNSVEKLIKEMNESRPWVPAAERERSLEVISKLRSWLEEAVAEQSKLSLFDDPFFRVKDIKKKMNDAQEEIYRLRAFLKEEDKKAKKPKNDDPSNFKIKVKDLIGALGLDAEGMAKVAAKFNLDSEETTFAEIIKFLKDEGIKSNLNKGKDDSFSEEAKKYAEEMAKNAKPEGGDEAPKKDPKEEIIDL